jgi:Ion channel
VIRAGARRRPPSRRAVRRAGFGVVLLLILAQLVFRLAAPDADWANFVSVVLQAAILVSALGAARVPRRPARLAWGLAAAVVAVSALALAAPNAEVGTLLVVTAALVVITPATIVYGAFRSLRDEGGITLGTMFGVLSIYLLLGYAFFLAFQAVADLRPGPFFSDGAAESSANLLYFSFVTMTTVGYGDLAPDGGAARALSIALALCGQIYLVTVVAIIVSNLGRVHRPASSTVARRGKGRELGGGGS